MKKTFHCLLLLISLGLLTGCVTGVSEDEVAQVYYNLGNSYSEQGKTADAVKAYSKALFYNPELFNAGYNLAGIYLQTKQFDEADEIIQELLEKEPDNSFLLELKAWSAFLQGRSQEALDIYNTILMKIPNHENSLFNAGIISMEEGNTDQAYHYFSSLYEYTPEDPDVLIRLGFLERAVGNPERAAEILESCLKINPENIECIIALGDIYSDLAFYGTAVEYYQKACEIEESSELYFKQAFILFTAVEDFENGMEALTKAVESGFNDKEQLKTLTEYPDLFRGEEIITFLKEKELYEPPETQPEEDAPEAGEVIE